MPSLLFSNIWCLCVIHYTKTPTPLSCSIPFQQAPLIDGSVCCEDVCGNVAAGYGKKF